MTIPQCLLLALLCLSALSPVWAEKPATGKKEAAKKTSSSGFKTLSDEHPSYEMTESHKQRLQKLLPHSYAKLSSRQPMHVVAIGDELVDMNGPASPAGDVLKGFCGVLTEQLADRFFYTGGVRVIAPNRGQPVKSVESQGPEVTLRCVGRVGTHMLHAMQSLTSFGFESTPDLVILCYGRYDALEALALNQYRESLQQVIAAVKAKGADLILLSPPLAVSQPAEQSLGRMVAYTSTMRELAAEAGVFYADLGDMTALIQVLPEAVKPEEVFPGLVNSYGHYYQWPGTQELSTDPTPQMHQRLGRWLLNQLLQEPQPMPWGLLPGSAMMESEKRLKVTFEIENRSAEKMLFNVLPMVLQRWQPAEATPSIQLEPGKKQQLSITYQRTDEPVTLRHQPLPIHEPKMRVPVLVTAGTQARVETLSLELQPVYMAWKTGSLFNQSGSFNLTAELVNTTQQELKDVQWTAEWTDQKLFGSVTLPPGVKQPLEMKLKLPSSSEAHVNAPLKLSVQAGELKLKFTRYMEVIRNFGLRDTMSMSGGPGAVGQVVLRADADEQVLFVTLDLKDIPLAAGPDNIALQGRLSIDARSYGKRQNAGATGAIFFTTGVADGPGRVGPIAPWAFGTGYAFLFDSKALSCQLTSRTMGKRIQLTVPRSYLRLHEWALGNGNSQIGLQVEIALYQSGEGNKGGYTPAGVWTLATNLRTADDAQRLPQLELTAKPTSRWSVIIW
jgi:hypothetical protein